MPPNNQTLDITTLETWLWEAACKIRGPVDAPKFKDYVLPLVFLIGVIDVVDFNTTQAGQRMVGDDRLRELVQYGSAQQGCSALRLDS